MALPPFNKLFPPHYCSLLSQKVFKFAAHGINHSIWIQILYSHEAMHAEYFICTTSTTRCHYQTTALQPMMMFRISQSPATRLLERLCLVSAGQDDKFGCMDGMDTQRAYVEMYHNSCMNMSGWCVFSMRSLLARFAFHHSSIPFLYFT